MPWVVAKFHSSRDGDGLTLTTFPSSWITKVGGKKYVLYPPVCVSGSELKRLVYKGAEPKDDWDLLHLKYVSQCFDSVTDALDYECKAANLSDADLEVISITGTVGKRKRKAKDIRYPNEPVSSEDEDVQEIISDPLATFASELEIVAENVNDQSRVMKVSYGPVGGAETGSGLKLLSHSGKAVKLIQNSTLELRQSTPVHRVKEPHTSLNELQRVKFIQNSTLEPRQLIPVHRVNEPQTSLNELQTSTPISKNGDDIDLKDLITKLDQKMSSQTKALMNRLSCIEMSISMLSAAMNNVKSVPSMEEDFSECENVIKIPVDTLEDLHALQREIASSSKFHRYMFKTLCDQSSGLMHRGIISLNRAVNSILVKLMTNNVALLLCVKGRALHKVSFEAHFPRLINLIFDIIKAKNVTGVSISMENVKRSIGDWFRISKQRQFRARAVTTFFEISGRNVLAGDDGDSDS